MGSTVTTGWGDWVTFGEPGVGDGGWDGGNVGVTSAVVSNGVIVRGSATEFPSGAPASGNSTAAGGAGGLGGLGGNISADRATSTLADVTSARTGFEVELDPHAAITTIEATIGADNTTFHTRRTRIVVACDGITVASPPDDGAQPGRFELEPR